MIFFLRLLVLCSLFSLNLLGDEAAFIYLKGYLGKDELAQVKERVLSYQKNPPKELGIAINSSSGDINEFLDLAKQISNLKNDKKVKIAVYIDDSALGPSAILPFLADQIDGSSFITWGDIPLSAENSMTTNILANRVISLIPAGSPKYALLRLLATAMADPKVFVVDDNGWKLTGDEKDVTHTRISILGQTLVINQNQLKELGLLHDTMSLEVFKERYDKQPINGAQPIDLKPIPASVVDKSLSEHIKYNPNGPNVIGRIAINDRGSSISQATWIYIKNALEYYKKNKPIFIILELNTPGGEVFAAENISDALKEMDTQWGVPVVAVINNWAMSAGAMLAYSSRFIAVTKDASMGAAEPIIQDTTGSTTQASEKVNSALRADFANRAKFFGRNPYIAEAMVDKDLILVIRHGKVIKLDNENQIRYTGPEPDVILSPKGKLLTLNAEQLMDLGVADILLPPKSFELITPQEKEKGKWAFSKELLSQNSFFAAIPQASVDVYEMDWKTKFFALLAHPMVQSALFLGMLLGFYIEINNPGVALPGIIAVACLFLIILSSFSQEIANWLEVIFVVVGLGIILVELFVLPTFGVLGILGIALFLIGIFSLMLPGLGSVSFEYDTKTFNAAGEAFLQRLSWLSATFIVAMAIMALIGRYLMPAFGGYNRFVLQGHEQEAGKGYIAGVDPHSLPAVGVKGTALTHLRPAGKVLIDDKIYDALSSGRFIDKDAQVIVAKIDGSTLMVKELT